MELDELKHETEWAKDAIAQVLRQLPAPPSARTDKVPTTLATSKVTEARGRAPASGSGRSGGRSGRDGLPTPTTV
jgi:hypothetical protein